MSGEKQYKNPKPTVDVLIEIDGGVVVIERKNPPPGWAIPGGFVDEGEPVEVAAVREMKEETGLDVVLTDLLYVYSDPRRDPRHHTETVVFIGRPEDSRARPVAGDDAAAALIVDPKNHGLTMAFDHAGVLRDYVAFRATGKRPDPMEMLRRWREKQPL